MTACTTEFMALFLEFSHTASTSARRVMMSTTATVYTMVLFRDLMKSGRANTFS